jgi:hypothetical protein
VLNTASFLPDNPVYLNKRLIEEKVIKENERLVILKGASAPFLLVS